MQKHQTKSDIKTSKALITMCKDKPNINSHNAVKQNGFSKFTNVHKRNHKDGGGAGVFVEKTPEKLKNFFRKKKKEKRKR